MTTERKRVILLSKRVTTEEDKLKCISLVRIQTKRNEKYQNVTVFNATDKRINGQKTK